MRNYQIKDLQLKEVIGEFTEEGVRQYAFDIVKERAKNYPNDELGIKFTEIVNKGFENFDLVQAHGILEDWSYRAVYLGTFYK